MRRLSVLALFMTIATAAVPDLNELNRMIARYAPTKVTANTSQLSPGDRQALAKLEEAARVVDDLFITQLWSGNATLKARLEKDTSPLGKARVHYFELNKGPWSDLDDHQAFLPDVPAKKPAGANFYPEDMTRDEFETWVAQTPQGSAGGLARGFFSVIRRGADRKLEIVPYDRLMHRNYIAWRRCSMRPRR